MHPSSRCAFFVILVLFFTSTLAIQLPHELDSIIDAISKQMHAIQDMPVFHDGSNKVTPIERAIASAPDGPEHHKHHKHAHLINKVLSLSHIYNFHPGELPEFIKAHFSSNAELQNSVWESHRYLEGHTEISNLFVKLWKKDPNSLLVLSDLIQDGNRVAAIIGIDFTDTVTKQRVRVEGLAMFYFNEREQIHRVYLSYDHHRVELFKKRTKVENPIVKMIFEKDPGSEEQGHIDHTEPFTKVSDLVLRYMDIWNNRDLKTMQFYHGTQFTKKTKLYTSSFGSDRHLEDYDRIKTFMTSEEFLRSNNSMHLVNDFMQSGKDVVLRYTRMEPVEHKNNKYFKKDNEVDPESTCKIPGLTCMKVEGIIWLKYNEDGFIEHMYAAQDAYRLLLKKGILTDIENDESLQDFEEAKTMSRR